MNLFFYFNLMTSFTYRKTINNYRLWKTIRHNRSKINEIRQNLEQDITIILLIEKQKPKFCTIKFNRSGI